MRTLIVVLSFFISHVWYSPVFSQETCKVLVPEISENYEGSCRKGLAHVSGTAWGKDHYEGQFRKGMPHGTGKYTWDNGNVYEGKWKEGMRHGKGTFIFEKDGEKVTLSGIWNNDEFYSEKKIPPYTVGHMINVERYNIRKKGDGNMILATVNEHGRVHPSPKDFMFHVETGSSITLGQASGYENVRFPAKVLITYEIHDKMLQGTMVRVRFEVTINEPGIWEIRFYH
jgi:hypothetical protein